MVRSLRLWRVGVIVAVFLVPFLVRTSPAQAATNVSGTISSNTTWTLANSPYVVTGDVTVASGVTLTVEPGVIVKFAAGKSLIVNGNLDAQAGPSSVIYFTSDKDDVGGDTNGDGTATSPARGDWAHIRVAGSAVMDYVEVRYGGKGLYSGLVYLTGSLTLRNATLTESYSTGLYRYSSSGAVTVEQSAIRNNATSGIYLSGSGAPSITNSTIQGNSTYGVYVSATNHAYINGNTFSGNGSTAVYVMAGNPAWNGQVTGNTFQTSASNPVTVNFSGGGLAATSDLSGNTFTGNVRNGIDLQGTMLLDSTLGEQNGAADPDDPAGDRGQVQRAAADGRVWHPQRHRHADQPGLLYLTAG